MVERLSYFQQKQIVSLNLDLMNRPISKLNKEWHLAHRMPKHATTEQRIEWHLEHSKHCSCRPLPEKLKTEIKKRLKH